MKSLTFAAAAATTLLTSSAFAGAPLHRFPAAFEAAAPDYELKTDGVPRAGKPLMVSLVDRASGQIVTDGQVAVLRPIYRGPKAVPAIQYVPEALPRDANGRFVCAAEHHTVMVTLRGAGPNDSSPVWLTLNVHS